MIIIYNSLMRWSQKLLISENEILAAYRNQSASRKGNASITVKCTAFDNPSLFSNSPAPFDQCKKLIILAFVSWQFIDSSSKIFDYKSHLFSKDSMTIKLWVHILEVNGSNWNYIGHYRNHLSEYIFMFYTSWNFKINAQSLGIICLLWRQSPI